MNGENRIFFKCFCCFFFNVYQFLGTTSNLRGRDVELYSKHSASLGGKKNNSKAEKEGCFFVMSFFRVEDREFAFTITTKKKRETGKQGKRKNVVAKKELGGSFFTDPISKFFF